MIMLVLLLLVCQLTNDYFVIIKLIVLCVYTDVTVILWLKCQEWDYSDHLKEWKFQ